MAKAVLVMDMPERCYKCPLFLAIPQKDGLALCLARPKNGQEEYNPKHENSWRPDWCPLVKLPEEKESDPVMDCDVDFGIAEGWNMFRDELEQLSEKRRSQ